MSCRYGRATVVDAVELHVAAGEHVALTGANGSGKTTLLRAGLGLHPLAGGTVSVDGQSARFSRSGC
ncbi:MAG: ATP-binding cassette domain-containing protein [Pseudonocardiaceae bacterium]